MRLAGVAMGLAVLGMLVPLAASAAESADPNVKRGHQLFGEYCARCHGQLGIGDGPEAAETRLPTADLTGIAARRGGVFPVAEVTEIIDGRRPRRAHGPSGMPVWGNEFQPSVSGGGPSRVVVNDRISALYAYLRSLQREAEAEAAPGEVQE